MEPFIGEIKMFGGNFAPQGYAFCNGQTIAISQNTALFALIGTTYGGDGQTTFNLPDLQCRVPIHQGQQPGGSSFVLGQKGGEETVTLNINQIPLHGHPASAVDATGSFPDPANNVWAQLSGVNAYTTNNPNGPSMDSGAISSTGGSQPHDNMLPFLAVNFIIALLGVFPSRN